MRKNVKGLLFTIVTTVSISLGFTSLTSALPMSSPTADVIDRQEISIPSSETFMVTAGTQTSKENGANSGFSQALNQRLNNAIVLCIGNSTAYVNDNKTQVDPESAETNPVIRDGRTLVPVRFISESLGAIVDWDGNTSKVKVSLNGKIVKMAIGNDNINIDGVDSKLDVPAQIVNGRTFIPFRALVEALGKKVFWDDRGLIVISDDENIFSLTKDRELIDEVVGKFTTTANKEGELLKVSSGYAKQGNNDVELDSNLYIAFEKYAYANDMSKIEVIDSNGNEIAMSNRELRASYYIINLIHNENFLPATRYTVNLKPGFAKDSDGNLSDAYTFNFTTVDISDTSTVTIKTSKGDITITLQNKKMPNTIVNFTKLANSSFYDGLTFHRVEDWVIQGGDPLGNGMGGSEDNIKLETNPELRNVRGAIGMARSADPDSATSQFYILKNDSSWLDGQYAIFGYVISGMDAVDKIEIGDIIISIDVKE